MNVIAIIVNSKARNAQCVSSYLEGFNEAKIAYKLYETEPEHLESTIQGCMKNHKILLVGGGDGTIRTAAQYCAHSAVILGVLPLGTLNHFSKELGLPQNVRELVESIKQKNTLKIDLAEVNGLVFVNNSSIGFYPKFARKRKKYSKLYNKWLSYIPSFIESLKKHETFHLEVKGTHLNCTLRTSFLMVSNNVYSYEFPATFKRDSFQKGLLGLYYLKQGKLRIFKIIQSLWGKFNHFEIDESEEPIEIRLKHHDEIMISLDGEIIKVKTPLHYKSMPGSLNILMKSS